METLQNNYVSRLDEIAEEIQASDLLATYIEEEEEELYNELRNAFEPAIQELHEEVAAKYPLQLIDFEKHLLEDKFEGLYLPRLIGYAVLRGELNEDYKYIRPQDHFKDILIAICNSNNFDVIKHRISQSVQIGFALSSDIWSTNIINSLQNKRVVYYLQSQKNEKFRDAQGRKSGFLKYSKQFESLDFGTAEFPESVNTLKMLTPSLKTFLLYRAENKMENESLMPHIKKLLDNKDFYQEKDFIELIIIIGLFYDLPDDVKAAFQSAVNGVRSSFTNFDETFFNILEEMQESDHVISAENQKRFSHYIDKTKKDELSKYFKTLDIINSKGYIDEQAIDAARDYYYQHEGLSIQNRCLRNAIFANFRRVLNNLTPEEYHEYFELNKTITNYINIFSNQKFNQDVKALSLNYITKLLKTYTDKRGRDYQDIKKFVTATFLDLGFMKQKELIELFKTKRKKKPGAE